MKYSIFIIVFYISLIIQCTDFKCPQGLGKLGWKCIPCSSLPGYKQINDTCYQIPEVSQGPGKLPDNCHAEANSVLWSWLAYSENITLIEMKDGPDFPRLKNCGNWIVSNEFHQTKFAVEGHASLFVNREAGVAVIAFRGTNAWFDEKRTWNDWLANFIVALTPCNFIPQCGKCHKGFLQVYLALREQIKITAKTFLDAKYKLVITGHSQGAAVATLCALDLVSQFPDAASRIHMEIFASPMVGDETFVSNFNKLVPNAKSESTRDVVTSLPPTWLGYRHIKGEHLIKCNPDYFSNPDPPKYNQFPNIPRWLYPKMVGCHFQQDGLLKEGPYIPRKSNFGNLLKNYKIIEHSICDKK